MRKLRHSGLKSPAQGHTTRKRRVWCLNLALSDPTAQPQRSHCLHSCTLSHSGSSFHTSLALLGLLSLLASAPSCLLQAVFPEHPLLGHLTQSCFLALSTIAVESTSTLCNDFLMICLPCWAGLHEGRDLKCPKNSCSFPPKPQSFLSQ